MHLRSSAIRIHMMPNGQITAVIIPCIIPGCIIPTANDLAISPRVIDVAGMLLYAALMSDMSPATNEHQV